MKNSTNAMPESCQGGSISRTLLLPREHHLGTGSLGTFRLRHILAEDGCKESQVALAKSLLTIPSNNFEERSFNAQLAVYWLLQAAEKGQEEAFSLLKECVSAGVGINARNHSEIEKCLKFSEEEKISRRVAYSLFEAIMSDTEDLVPEQVFQEKIETILKEESKEKLSAKTAEDLPLPQQQPCQKKIDEASLRNQAHVSFSEVVNSVQSCLEGNVPLVSLKQVTHYAEYKRWLSTKYLRILWDLVLRSAENLFHNLSSLVYPITFLLLCLLLQLANFLSPSGNEMSNFIKQSMLKCVTLFSLTAMISSTCFVVHINFGGENVKKWLHLVKFFEPNIRSDQVERKFLSKTTSSLTTFLLISLIYISLVSLSSTLMSSTDLGILSLVLMLFVDRTITHQRYYVNISFFLNALTCLYKANALQNMFINSLSFLNLNITYEIMENIYIHLSLISCLALPFVLPYLYVKMALGQRRGWHLVLLPHLMSLVWMNLASIHLANTATTSQLFSLFSWLVILILSNYIGIVLTSITYALLKVYTVDDFKVELLFLSLVFIVLYFISCVFVKKSRASNESKLWPSLICLSLLVLSYQAVKPEIPKTESASGGVIPWEKYQTYCHHHAWYRTNTAEVQISCLPLKGREISLEGTITAVDVIQVKNNMQFIANVMPQPLQSWFVCLFGKNYANCDSETLSQFEKDRCKLYENLNINKCHLHNWNEYKYQIVLEVSSRTSPEVILFANNACTEFVTNLKEGDSLQVIGVLESNIGSSSPKLTIRQALCTSCYADVACNTFSALPLPDFRLSLKNLIKLYLEPFLQYEPK
ncbi:Wolframin [Araneus ventricosus]|uniref:Wolframin n=1 Tax=Araneus ventricosus TaxID=182803 RepID=A0A4Y2AIB3_ARAVE|nr:Wolframin [Araneus ventricosus]